MDFLNALNETAVTYVRDLAAWGWADMPGEGYEAISFTGEIRAFRTYAEANAWRLSELVAA